MTILNPCTLKSLALLEGIRKAVLVKVDALTEKQALFVPEGFRNCVHWHIGHILHVQLAHWYTRRGELLPIDLGFKKYFRDGTSPANYDSDTPTFSSVLNAYRKYSFSLELQFSELLEAPLSQPFEYMNIYFSTVSDDLRLLIFHEGEHFPMVVRLLKVLSQE